MTSPQVIYTRSPMPMTEYFIMRQRTGLPALDPHEFLEWVNMWVGGSRADRHRFIRELTYGPAERWWLGIS